MPAADRRRSAQCPAVAVRGRTQDPRERTAQAARRSPRSGRLVRTGARRRLAARSRFRSPERRRPRDPAARRVGRPAGAQRGACSRVLAGRSTRALPPREVSARGRPRIRFVVSTPTEGSDGMTSDVIARLAAANPVPGPNPEWRARRSYILALAAAALLVPAAYGADRLLGISNEGTSVPSSSVLPGETKLDEAMQELHVGSTMQSLGTLNGVAFYASRNAAGAF